MITVLPPDSEPQPNHYVANIFEWHASTIPIGGNCWFRKRVRIGSRELGPWKPGVFLSAFMYDGVIAKVYEHDPDDYVEYSLFLDLGDELVPWEDGVVLKQWAALTQQWEQMIR